MPEDTAALLRALSSAANEAVTILSRQPLGGGDISQVERVVTTGGAFVVKRHVTAPPGFFHAEAAGLTALRRSGTSLRVPEVLAVGDDTAPLIVLEDLGRGRSHEHVDEVVGRGLAELHRHHADRFGFDRETFCGLTPQPNAWTDRWVAFYGEQRLRPQVARATHTGQLSSGDAGLLDALIAKLDTLIDEPVDGPSLIHGDLWSGNLHIAADGRPALIDPSVAFAHREAEFGMMTLFGGFGARVYDAYEDAFPLEPGWRERNPLYQLYHLLNHFNLFGGAYRGQVMAVARRFA